jgi:hypothetical protein
MHGDRFGRGLILLEGYNSLIDIPSEVAGSSDVKAQLSLKALAQAWLHRAQASSKPRPGFEVGLRLGQGPARLGPQPVHTKTTFLQYTGTGSMVECRHQYIKSETQLLRKNDTGERRAWEQRRRRREQEGRMKKVILKM